MYDVPPQLKPLHRLPDPLQSPLGAVQFAASAFGTPTDSPAKSPKTVVTAPLRKRRLLISIAVRSRIRVLKPFS